MTRETVQQSLVDTSRHSHEQRRPLTVDKERLRSMAKTIEEAWRIMRDESQSATARQLRVKSMVALAAGGGGRNISHELGTTHRRLRTWLKTWLFGHRRGETYHP